MGGTWQAFCMWTWCSLDRKPWYGPAIVSKSEIAKGVSVGTIS